MNNLIENDRRINKLSKVAGSLFLLITVAALQFVSLWLKEETIVILAVFIYSIFLGYKRLIPGNYLACILKFLIIEAAVIAGHMLDAAAYAYFIAGGDFVTEYSLGSGYVFMFLWLKLLLMIPLYFTGLFLGWGSRQIISSIIRK